MYQLLTCVGRVGSDPDLSYTNQGVALCKFSLAINKTTGKGESKKQSTTWIKVTVWRERAEIASQYVKKGNLLLVTGEVSVSAYTNKQGQAAASLELTANDFKFLSSVEHADDAPTENRSNVTEEAADVPF